MHPHTHTCTHACMQDTYTLFNLIFLQPFGDATLGNAGLVIIPIFVAFSTFGAANGSVYTSSRLIFGAARDRLLPDFLSGLHTKYKTPVPAIILLVSYLILASTRPQIHSQLSMSLGGEDNLILYALYMYMYNILVVLMPFIVHVCVTVCACVLFLAYRCLKVVFS